MKWNPFTHTKTGPYMRFIYSCISVCGGGGKQWQQRMNEWRACTVEECTVRGEGGVEEGQRAWQHECHRGNNNNNSSLRARAQQQVDTFMRHLNDTTPQQVWPGRPYERALSLTLSLSMLPLPTCDLRYRLTCKQLCAVRRGREAAQQLQLSS